MKSIALTMITRNEERCIARCLDSISPWVDEMIVLDTGSTDSTIEIARSKGAIVHEHEWKNDFSEARNASLDRSSADWNVIMDADEWLSSGGEHLHNLRELSHHAVYNVKIESLLSDSENSLSNIILIPRIIPKGVRYTGRVHEHPNHELERLNSKIVFKHDGYTPNQKTRKSGRNLALLQEAIQDNPEDPYYYYQIGKEYDSLKKDQEAVNFYIKALDMSKGFPLWRHDLTIRVMECLRRSRRLEEAINFLSHEISYWKNSSDFHYVAGTVLIDQFDRAPNDSQELLPLIDQLFNEALNLGDNDTLPGSVKGRGSFLAAHQLGLFHERIGDNEKAKHFKNLCEKMYINHLDRQNNQKS